MNPLLRTMILDANINFALNGLLAQNLDTFFIFILVSMYQSYAHQIYLQRNDSEIRHWLSNNSGRLNVSLVTCVSIYGFIDFLLS